LLFGLYHVYDYIIFNLDFTQFIAMLPTFIMGLALTVLYEKTNNICYLNYSP